ncbi:transcription factor subunit Med10 of mediator complex-domain-containing protein [Dunaliella salina]|uniref:Mediator of RNA polymerase II transcription subunit 10 n=1 Tax=Dunaliella salina TaxID=3046 RepID=A0ABQ7H484_DUNSA|nr:transcription factor subunit Med10 of mediator complex-domain-containing protein [Dunaliella salina]|eukprot:KAF5841665.1 transcription factor subunit Med10 of mediator complex-domain-containing protein [Dunaliella salina]
MEGNKLTLHSLKDLVGKTWEIEEVVRNYGPETQPALQERMMQYINSVAELRNHTAFLEDVRVPMDMLQYLDEGGNVNQYTAEVFKACDRDNQASKGKVEAVQCLWDSVVARMEADMPETASAYRHLLESRGQAVHPSVLSGGAQNPASLLLKS